MLVTLLFLLQLWVYGSSFENFLVAVVVPKLDQLRQAAQQQGVTHAASMDFKVKQRCVDKERLSSMALFHAACI